MKKTLILFVLAISLVSTETTAQSLLNRLNRAVDGYRQRSQQRTIQRNNSQQTYPNRQRYEQQERANQQRRGEQQRGYTQQQRSNVNEEYSRTASTVRSEENNTTQSNDKIVTLVVNGTGTTEKEATQNALRSAIEQAFGTFVSANTEVLNDELVKDEIATVASGNISQYKILSTSKNGNGLYDVSLQAVVSIGNLTNYTQSKGFQVELAGAKFVMNMKMRELNKKNELAAIEHLQKKLKSIAKNGGLFNYELEKSEPILIGDSKYGVKLKLLFFGNENTKAFYDEIYKTIGALSLSASEIEEYRRVGMDYFVYDKQLIMKEKGEYALRNNYHNLYQWIGRELKYYDNASSEISWLMPILVEQALQFVIYDNLGNQFYCIKDTKYISKGCIWHYCGSPKNNKCNEVYYYLNPLDRIAFIKGNYFMRQESIGSGYATKDIVIGIPIYDYIPNVKGLCFGMDARLHFNPMEEDCEFECTNPGRTEARQERTRKNCYFQLEFFLEYSEDELYKLENISVKSNNTDMVSTKMSNSDLSSKSQTEGNINLINSNDRTAEFPGGTSAMSQYISSRLKYPVVAEENGIQGNVVIQFYVEIDGSITDPTVSKSVDPSLDKEALRMVRSMPKWNPAQKNGEAVRSQQTITIPFRL